MIPANMKMLAAIGALTSFAATPAMAADASGARAAQQDSRTAPSTEASGKSAAVKVKAEELVGKDVKNMNGEDLGEIESVLIDKDGRVAAVILEVGGFLGMGERLVAIRWKDLEYRRNGEEISANFTKAQLKEMPEYKYRDRDNRRKAFIDSAYLAENETGAATDVKGEWTTATGMRASKIRGADVVNPQGENIGEVSEVIIENGSPMLVLSVGEFLGMGGHQAAVPLEKVTVFRKRDDADELRVSLSMSKEQVKALPEFDAEAWAKTGRTTRQGQSR